MTQGLFEIRTFDNVVLPSIKYPFKVHKSYRISTVRNRATQTLTQASIDKEYANNSLNKKFGDQ